MTVAHLIFWTSLFLLAHTYLLYPLILKLLSCQRKKPSQLSIPEKSLPSVSILMAVHNEESVIERKIESILKTDYPGRLEIIIGSDCSADNTNKILHHFSQKSDMLKYVSFEKRTGKGNVINALAGQANGEILIITDADVLFTPGTVKMLARNFTDPDTGLVDAHMKPERTSKSGIAVQESVYISWEVKIKYLEGKLWGTMMGPFGGCFAIRKNLYSEIPPNFLVDDFYLNMKVLEAGKKSFSDKEALVYEYLSEDLKEEFRRKTRISAGNFQNLKRFYHLLLPPWKAVSFSFFSHKIIRWHGPFLLILLLISNALLYKQSEFFMISFWVQSFLLVSPLLDFLLEKIGIQIIILRLIAHFYIMNAALFRGFLKHQKGIKSNAWEPTKRSS